MEGGPIKNKIEELKVTTSSSDEYKLSPSNHKGEDEMGNQEMQDLTLMKKDEEGAVGGFEMADQEDRTGKNCLNRMNSNEDMIPYELPESS